MALTPSAHAVKVDPPMGTVTDDLLNLPGEKVVPAQPAGAFNVDIPDDNKMKAVKATAIKFTGTRVAVAVGQWTQLFVNFDPSYTGDKNIVWSVDDATVGTVDKHGVVSGLKDGVLNVTATVKSQPTVKATIAVTVGKGAPEPKPTITPVAASVAGKKVGDKLSFTSLFTIKNSVVADYTVTATNGATVDANNAVTLTAEGDTAVTATLKADATVKATATATGVTAAA